MKKRGKKLLAALMAVSLLMGQSGNILAEEAEPDAAAAVEAPVETAAPETAPPETAPPETAAPETQAPEPEPVQEAPAETVPDYTEETQASGGDEWGEASISDDNSQSYETESPIAEETSVQTETAAPVTETETEKKTETETETEKKINRFTTQAGDCSVTVVLDAADAQSESAVLELKVLDRSSREYAVLEDEVTEGHRQLTDAAVYSLTLKKDGREVTLSRNAQITVSFSSPRSLGIPEYHQGEVKVYQIGNSLTDLGNASVDDDLNVTGFSLNAPLPAMFAAAGISNHINQGEKLTRSYFEKGIKDLGDYAVITNYFDGKREAVEGDILDEEAISALKEEKEEYTGKRPKDILKDLEDVSLELADARSTDDFTVVNLYADERGKVDLEPLEEVLADDLYAVDVSDNYVLINIIADDEYAPVEIPWMDIRNEYSYDPEKEMQDTAEKLVWNLTAQDDTEFTGYKGTAVIKDDLMGTLLAPEGTVELRSKLQGGVYADTVKLVGDTAAIEMWAYGYNPPEETETETEEPTEAEVVTEAAETETETEEPSEVTAVTEAAETETETEQAADAEIVTAAVTEAGTETEEVTETEIVTEAAETETGTETATETVTEAETEEDTESVTEEATEAVTEEALEAVTEEALEAVTEDITEAVTEVETETETEPASEAPMVLPTKKKMLSLKASEVSKDQVSVDVLSKDAAGSFVPGVIYEVVYEDGTALLDESGNPLRISPAEDSHALVISGAANEAIASLGKVTAETEGAENTEDKDAQSQQDTDASGANGAGSNTADEEKNVTGDPSVNTNNEEQKGNEPADGKDKSTQDNSGSDEAATSLNVIIKPVTIPAGYTTETAEQTVAISRENREDALVAAPTEVSFVYDKLATEFTVTLTALEGNEAAPGASLKGAEFALAVIDTKTGKEKVLTDTDGNELKLTTDDKGSAVLTQDALKVKELNLLAAGSSLEVIASLQKSPSGYTYTDTHTHTFTITKDEKGNLTEESRKLAWTCYFRKANSISIEASAIRKDNKQLLSGAVFTLRNRETGEVLNGTDGKPIKVTTAKDSNPVSIVFTESENPALRKLTAGTVLDLVLSETTTPILKVPGKEDSKYICYGYLDKDGKETTGSDKLGPMDQVIQIVREDDGSLRIVSEQSAYAFLHVANTFGYSDKITVEKWNYYNNVALYSNKALTVYAALFSDEQKTKRVSDILTIKIGKDQIKGVATFEDVAPGTYYLGETDQYGRLVGTEKDPALSKDPFRTYYRVENNGIKQVSDKIIVKVSDKVKENKTENKYRTYIQNVYFKSPAEFHKSSTISRFSINKEIRNSKGLVNAQGSFKFRILNADTQKVIGTVSVPISGGKGQKSVGIKLSEDSVRIAIEEINVPEGYTPVYDHQVLTVSLSQKEIPTFNVVNVMNKEKEEEEEKKEQEKTNTQAVLTLRKNVTYKGRAMPISKANFYIGIWYLKNTGGSTAGEPTWIKKVTVEKSSSGVRDVEVNLPQGQDVTLAVAEMVKTTSGWKKAAEVSAFGYTVDNKGQTVTLDMKNKTQEVSFTNDIKVGGSIEQKLTDPTSGFAASPAALAEAQALANDKNITAATGDDTPILPLVLALGGSGLAIAAAVLFFVLRRKKK